jgi:chemotaxis signal transduction protein/LysM repeat protein
MRELLLASFGGRQYGIWKDAILSVRDLHALHRIPLCPAGIAGIMIDEGQTVTLADLSVCIGYESSPAIGTGCILLMADGEKVTGFVVSGELRTQSISPKLIFPLPDYLKTPVFDTCAIHDGISIPIINIAALYSRVLESGDKPAEIPLGIAAAHPQDASGVEQLRFFTVAGERYAVPAAGTDDKAVKPGPVTPLPNMPQYVKGVSFSDGRLLPVIDLTQRIKRHSAAPESRMLVAKIADDAFGFLIDSDEGTSPADKVSIKPAPLIAQTAWLKNVAVRAGELIPLVDLAMVLSPDSGVADENPLWQRYAPGSRFPGIFFKHEVGVVEFSLLGVHYALPKVEVEEVIAFKPCRTLPGVAPIVTGVAEHNGEILPVVDLAMMFGRRSLATPGWRMMLVNNGDFRALVITEAVFGERRLPLDRHRTVPIHLPHNLMYGCYPDADAVRIILNVEVIAVHFEKSLIQIFMPALSQEMRMSPTGVVYTFPEEQPSPEENVAGQIQSLAKATPVQAEPEPVTEAAPAAEISPAGPEFEQQAEEETAEFVEWGEADSEADAIARAEEPGPEPMDIFLEAVSSASTRKSRATADEWIPGAAFEQEHVPKVSETTIAPDVMTAAAETQEYAAPVQGVPDREPSAQGNKAREPAAMSKESPLESLKAAAKKKQARKASATADSRPAEPARTTASAESGEQDDSNRETEPRAEWSVYEEHSAGKMWKRTIAYGAIVAALIAVLHFAGTSDQPVAERSAQGTAQIKTEQSLVQPEQPRTETVTVQAKAGLAEDKAEQAKMEAEQAEAKAQAERDAKAQAEIEAKTEQEAKQKGRQTLVLSPLTGEQIEPARPMEKSRAPLELDIPKNMPVDIDVYVVQKGDTLWSISQRFTGSPYNYPRIAGENRIAEPDLIFPGQRIRLIK